MKNAEKKRIYILEYNVEIYTDGACSNNPGPGGWGVVMLNNGRVFEYGGQCPDTTNNIMEMTAALKALQIAAPMDCPVIIRTDSQYLKKGITQWVHLWKVKGWKKADGDEIKNLEIWKELDRLNKPEVRWEWVKGHADNPFNNRADEIASAFSRNEPLQLITDGDVSLISIDPDRSKSKKTYLSLVGGIPARHNTWNECKARVHNVPGAKLKACKNEKEQKETLEKWGVSMEDPDKPEESRITENKADNPAIIPDVVTIDDNIHQSLKISVGLPYFKYFTDNLIKKGFTATGEVIDCFQKDEIKVLTGKKGLFEIQGPAAPAGELAKKIADADIKYSEKFLSSPPADFPSDLSLWREDQLRALARPFLKGMVTAFKFTIEDNEIFAGRNPSSPEPDFIISLKEKPRWIKKPGEDSLKEIIRIARTSLYFPDRALLWAENFENIFMVSVFAVFNDKTGAFSRLREWRVLRENFHLLAADEKTRITGQLNAHLKNISCLKKDIREKSSVNTEMEEWLLKQADLFTKPLMKYKNKILPELITDTSIPGSVRINDGPLKINELIIQQREPRFPGEKELLELSAFKAFTLFC